MKITHITPGAAGMFCGGCLRDNALVKALRSRGAAVKMIPLYTPLHLDEADQSKPTPIFFGGINVFLDQKSSLIRKLPLWTRRWLDSPLLLNSVSAFAAKTNPADLGDLTLSTLRGSEGFQASEIELLINWLKQHERPDIICLSNILLGGLAARLKSELKIPIVSYLQGEDYFLDSLPIWHIEPAWSLVRKCVASLDLLIAPSEFYAETMAKRLHADRSKIRAVLNGINLEGYAPASNPPPVPTIGFFARMCREKGLGLLVDSFLRLKRDPRFSTIRLKVGGSCTGTDVAYMKELKNKLDQHGLSPSVEFLPNVSRDQKIDFFRSINVLCTPATYGEAFGLYVLEALACGVPVVAPPQAAFPEIFGHTGGGVLADPTPEALGLELGELLLNPIRARELGEAGRKAVHAKFSIQRMSGEVLQLFDGLVSQPR